ncbi:aldose 1-epimerase [Pseudoxanthomonas sp. 3HH-4]|nr:aldose 1-epimerase [Pseudoxanthomonas sp. 3HH-4]
MPAGPLHSLRAGRLQVALAPDAGGRLAQIRFDGMDWLVGPDDGWPATIAWGCYPMVPWAGRLRGGRFDLDGMAHALPVNFGGHAIHGIGFSRPWQMDVLDANRAEMSLVLPEDDYWPFGGTATQSVRLEGDRLFLQLAVQAGTQAMPAVLGWHPWFRKPDRLVFEPTAMYPRDADGIATLPRIPPSPGPWDDCFVAGGEIALHRADQVLQLRADTDHWVVYDGAAHSTCVEPQTGPPDGFTLVPRVLSPGQRLHLAFELAWQAGAGRAA